MRQLCVLNTLDYLENIMFKIFSIDSSPNTMRSNNEYIVADRNAETPKGDGIFARCKTYGILAAIQIHFFCDQYRSPHELNDIAKTNNELRNFFFSSFLAFDLLDT